MKNKLYVSLALAAGLAFVLSFASRLAAQAPASGTIAAAEYKAPRTADGQPDLSGVWANNDATPLERPKELEGRQASDRRGGRGAEEAGRRALQRRDGRGVRRQRVPRRLKDAKDFKSTDTQTGNYNHFWIVDRESIDNRTSLISDPDGRTDSGADALRREAVRPRPPNTARRIRPTAPRICRSATAASPSACRASAPATTATSRSSSRKDYVAIDQEMIHDVRIIPLDGRPHVDANIRQWLGDSRGHWEGDTLVVETTNFAAGTEAASEKPCPPGEPRTRSSASPASARRRFSGT